jgi:purine-binding chemotaxis protein CheW
MDALQNSIQMEGIDVPARAEASLRVCLITLGSELYAIDLRSVREVFAIDSITRVPGVPSILAGVSNLRGLVIPLVNLRLMLGLSISGFSPQLAVVIRHGANQMGLLVEHVPEIRTIQKEQLLPSLQAGRTEVRPFVSAVLRLDSRVEERTE